jgi:5'-nucleotidase
MVATLRAVGVTHAILGNHEADLRLPVLHKRLEEFHKSTTLISSNVGRHPMNSQKAPWMWDILQECSILETSCQRVRVALMGLLSDETAVFRNGHFRGIPIHNVIDTWDDVYQRWVQSPGGVDILVPLTHQTLSRDRELAEHILHRHCQKQTLLLGGHEHEPIDVTVTSSEDDDSYVRIIKSGCEAQAVSLIDLTLEPRVGDTPGYITDMQVSLVDMLPYENSVVVQGIVQSHQSLLETLEHEPIVQDANALLPPGVPLSSERTRYQQTTVGGLFCTAIKEELECDVAILNGAPIKGERTYPNASMSYAELKDELPFPCKLVVVPMKRWELHDAIHYSRTCPTEPGQAPGLPHVMRRGYLQVDIEFDRIGFHTGAQDDDLMVALPRNLMKGFCNIQPLIDVGKRLKAQGKFPSDDDYIPAINVIIRHFCKERWYEIVHENLSFGDLDKGHKGYLSREDVKRMLRKALGHEPADFVVGECL